MEELPCPFSIVAADCCFVSLAGISVDTALDSVGLSAFALLGTRDQPNHSWIIRFTMMFE